MIEIVYNEKLKTTTDQEPYVKIPKNIRQIGQIDDVKKVYIEDYVVTYVNQLSEYYDTFQQVGILLGHTYEIENKKYIFVSGAVQVEDMIIDDGYRFDDLTWSSIYENIKKFFDASEIVGWFIARPDFEGFDWKEVTKTHLDHFAGNDKIFAKVSAGEKEIRILAYENSSMEPINGYYIYYEKNQEMQNYMIDQFQKKETVTEVKTEAVEDNATRHFREIIQEKKDTTEQSKLMVFMYTSSVILIMVVFVIGITLLNNFDKMKNMEKTLAHITDAVTGEETEMADTTAVQADTAEDTSVPVESAEAGVSLQDAVTQENAAAEASSSSVQAVTDTPAATDAAAAATTPAATDAAAAATTPAATDAAAAATTPAATDAAAAATTPAATDAAATATPAATDTTAQQAVAQPVTHQSYVIQKGDTLLSISRKFYNTDSMISEICSLNNIQNSDQINYGQTILLP